MANVQIDGKDFCQTVGNVYFIRPGLVAFLGILYTIQQHSLFLINEWLSLASVVFGYLLISVALGMAKSNKR